MDKYQLITKHLQEVVGEQDLQELLKTRSPVIYWGTAPTGKPSIGYLVPVLKIADFLRAGCTVKILFANMHAYLDNMKSTWDQLEYRTQFYQLLITEILKIAKVPIEKLEFVKGTDFQLQEQYTLDMYKLCALVSTRDTIKAGAQVVKQIETPKMSSLLYPVLQALDEQYLGVDVQFGGVDQRKIFMFAREFLPKIGYNKRIHLMNPLIPGLGASGKMSSSQPNSKIDFDDSDAIIQKKIQKAHCVDGDVQNGLLPICKYILFELYGSVKISRPQKYGGDIVYETYETLEADFVQKKLSSFDLKQAVSSCMTTLISPVRATLEKNTALIEKAYD
ncbi:MAG: tyrosine--tRNA ligase [Candidatus Woesearchaeota archaeon]